MVFVRLYQRVSQSYEVALGQYKGRVAAGLQPSTRVVDLFNVDTEEALLLSANFLYLGLVILLYLRMLKRKEPVRHLRGLMLGYNTLNVCVSLFVAISLLFFKINSRGFDVGGVCMGSDECKLSPGGVGGFVCNPLRTDLQGQMVARVFAVFYLQKYLELVDTFLFLLRKSFRQQVTFFHLFHHCSITVIVGSVLPFDFNGDMYLPIMLNSIVHVLVYLHYVLTALGRHSWWSRHLTKLQLTQFVVILVQSATALYRGPGCGSPDFVKVVLLMYMASLLGLFALFFAKRSILGPAEDPGMCGVIKSLETDGDASGGHGGGRGRGRGGNYGGRAGIGGGRRARAGAGAAWHGNVVLDDSGAAEVRFQASFLGEPPDGVVYSYQLTPIGASMPELFISEEVTAKSSSSSSSSSDRESSGGGGGGSGGTDTSGIQQSGRTGISRRRSGIGGGSTSMRIGRSGSRFFSIKGGKPRSAVSWTVTTVELQQQQQQKQQQHPSLSGTSSE
ncbi:unnamed protein product [Pylaiella littoralis]